MSLFTGFRQSPPTGGEAEADPTADPTPDGSSGSAPADVVTAADAAAAAGRTGEGPAGETARDTADGEKPPDGEETPATADAAVAPRRRGLRARYPSAARAVTRLTTATAAVLVLAALLLPNRLPQLGTSSALRIPVEGLFCAAMLLGLRPRNRRRAAVVVGTLLGVLTIVKLLDMGFYAVLARPFDLVLDWSLFGDGISFLVDSVGEGGAISVVVAVVVLVIVLPAALAWATLRVSGVLARHQAVAARATWTLGMVWVALAALGAQIYGTPMAAMSNANLVRNRIHDVRAGLRDERAFAKKAAVDPFRGVAPDRLLAGLRGKDVIFTFIESYGRSAIENSPMAPGVDAVLADGTRRLSAAGFSTRSAFLTSPTYGGGSWLAHSTFMSGLWIKNQQRYRTATSSDRMTLTAAFKRAGAWRTVGIMPGVTRAWPESKYYGLDSVWDSRTMGYHGPQFSWSHMPDQYSLLTFERLVHGKPGPKPLMAEIILTSSHTPWAPLPRMLPWDQVGDGSVYQGIKQAGKDPEQVWKSASQVRAEYGHSVEYSLSSLISYVEKYGNDKTVLVFLGDHQPAPIVSGNGSSHDVPVAIVAHDPAVLDKISSWGWQDGLQPGPKAPVWRMDTFRDRFLSAYGSPPAAARR